MSAYTRRTFLRQTVAGIGGTAALAVADAAVGDSRKDDTFRGRFAICNELFGDWPFEKALALAAECGYEGIEIAPFTVSNYVTDVSSRKRKEIRRQAEQAGLEVVGLHWLLSRTKGFHLTSPDRAVRDKTADYLGELARFCRDLGGKLLIFGSPQQRNLLPGVGLEEGMKHATEVLQAVLPVLEETDTTLAMEPLSPRTTNFMSTAAEAVELIDMVDSSRCRLILDCNAMSTEQEPIPELLRKHHKQLIHFHANDPNQQGPGFGKLDFLPIFKTLRQIQYGGWVSVEVFDYSPGPEKLARQSIRHMKECLLATES